MKLSDIILGIDLGGTIYHKVDSVTQPMPDAFRVIKKLKSLVRAIYIVSRVNDEQSLRAYKAFQTFNFFEETGLTPNKVYFCAERRDKSPICSNLGVNYFIDDRPECLYHMSPWVDGILMNPSEKDLKKYEGLIRARIVKAWVEVEEIFDNYAK